ncbi:MAG: FG-GAP repeat protein [Planctomycetaceae bacterium]|nr:FG-GAP repeat protein [Planctomycetaceae bacterium]
MLTSLFSTQRIARRRTHWRSAEHLESRLLLTSSQVDLGTLNGVNGVTLYGANAGDFAGVSVRNAGDVNGDGIDDVIVGAAFDESADPGKCYVLFGNSSGQRPVSLTLDSLDGLNGFTLLGIDPFDDCGHSVSSAGDVNQDGFDDLLIGAPLGDGPGNDSNTTGEVYVVFGKSDWSATPSLSLSALNGTNGFTIFGNTTFSQRTGIGWDVAAAGDVNNDGFDDVLIGTIAQNEAYVVFGKADWSGSPTFSISDLNGTNGFAIEDSLGNFFGSDVRGTGDINNDGFDDLIFGAVHDNGIGNAKPDSGKASVLFGKSNWSTTPVVDLTTLDGTTGLTIFGIDSGDLLGGKVGYAGDVNNDGFDDLIVSATGGDGPTNTQAGLGEAYVLFGKSNWTTTAAFDPSTLNGTNGFTIYGSDPAAGIYNVTSAGDFNNDGFDDLLLSDLLADGLNGAKPASGETFVLFGKENWSATPTVSLAGLNGSTGITFFGADAGDVSGGSISTAGDVNHDGYSDLIVGAVRSSGFQNAETDAGEAYIIFGHPANHVPIVSFPSPSGKFYKKGSPVHLDVGAIVNDVDTGVGKLGAGNLHIALDLAVSGKKLRTFDVLQFGTIAAIGSSAGSQRIGNQQILDVHLNADTTPAAVQSFLRDIQFSTAKKGLKTPSRTIHVQLTDSLDDSALADKTIDVSRKKKKI